jgi:Arc/MetJ-type ribon-helix-helix transcriptional regulator
MATPAPPSHFLRIFGQPTRDSLGEFRDHSATMRQALMMLNGRLTHEAARVGELEPVYPLVAGKKPDLPAAIRLVYRELLTREPTKAEIDEAQTIVKEAANPQDGIADLRWVLFNCHEFRYLP